MKRSYLWIYIILAITIGLLIGFFIGQNYINSQRVSILFGTGLISINSNKGILEVNRMCQNFCGGDADSNGQLVSQDKISCNCYYTIKGLPRIK